jgi:hypothetical protein
MDLRVYNMAEKFVIDSFTNVGKTQGIKHFLRTVYWLKELEPKADEALLIAAVAHDVERAFRKTDQLERIEKKGYTAVEVLRPHEERGAEVIADFLKKQNASSQLIEKVKMLVSRHEEGGNNEQNLIKDADSISFFENQTKHFLTVLVKQDGKEKIKEKFDWMYNRIASEKAKQITQPLYKKAIDELKA